MTTPRVLITGAASGLGRELALAYARRGARILVTDVDEAGGRETVAAVKALGAHGHFLPCDVRREADLLQVREALVEIWGGVDIVINNAGVAGAGRIETTSLADWEWILDINLLGVVRGCKVFTPLFKQQGHGHFVNVASMAGLMNLPAMASYSASKAGVIALSETLRHELAACGIRTTVVCPSFFRTRLADSLRTSEPALQKSVQRLLEQDGPSAAAIAAQVVKAVEQGRYMLLPHRKARLAWTVKRALPWLFRWRVGVSARRLQAFLDARASESRA